MNPIKRGCLCVLAGLMATLGAHAQEDTAAIPAVTGAPVFLFNESMLDDEHDDAQYVSAALASANDVFTANAGYAFSAMRFRIRGYQNNYTQMSLNGVTLNDLERGVFSYSMLGGLNDVVRNSEDISGISAIDYGFGNVGGASNIIMRASQYTPGSRVSLAYTNRNYKTRATYTYSTGLLPSGWAFTAALGYRWADEGYIEGTFYNSLGYLAALEKVFNNRHSLSITSFGAPTQRGGQSANTQEVYNLRGTNYYNAYWGYQDGKKRNSRIVTNYEPVVLFNHLFTPDKDTKLNTGLALRASGYGSTALAYNNAPNPSPTYYRNLPSYQTTDAMKSLYTSIWQAGNPDDTQINWNDLYMANKLAKDDGQSARYILEERHNDQKQVVLSSVLNHRQSEHLKTAGGIEARYTKGLHYKTVADLLGADRFSDIDQYTENYSPINPNIQYNDLNSASTIKKKDDVFGYNYTLDVLNSNAWFQNNYSYNNWDYYYAAKVDYTRFQREGMMRNGRSPNNSYGRGQVHSFLTHTVKGGATWKPSGNHLVSANLLAATNPPLPNNAYISPRIKDDAVKGLGTEAVTHTDLNYTYNSRIIRGRVSVYYTRFADQVEIDNFYNDEMRTFVNSVLTGVDKVHKGLELGLSAKLTSELTATVLGSVGDFYYDSRPTATISVENGMQADVSRTIYLKNYKVSGTPQTAFNVELSYAHPAYWFFDLGASYYGNNYIDMTPIRRTAEILQFNANSYADYMAMAHKITDQEKYQGGIMVDASIGKSIRLDNGNLININLQVNNLLNNLKMKTGGYEQGRFDYVNYNVDKYPPYYYYAQGLNAFLMVAYRF